MRYSPTRQGSWNRCLNEKVSSWCGDSVSCRHRWTSDDLSKWTKNTRIQKMFPESSFFLFYIFFFREQIKPPGKRKTSHSIKTKFAHASECIFSHTFRLAAECVKFTIPLSLYTFWMNFWHFFRMTSSMQKHASGWWDPCMRFQQPMLVLFAEVASVSPK